MSLIICANQYEGTSERTSNNNQAYSFKNNLGTQMTIPKNSEIAVQSVKINKDGTITIKPSDIFYIYQGGLVGPSATFTDMNQSNSYPIQVQLNETGLIEELTIDELNSRIQIALNRGIINLAFNGLQTSTLKRNSGTGVFEGFEIKVSQQNASDSTKRIPATATPYYNGLEANYTYSASGVFTSVNDIANSNQRVAILTDYPLGNVGGKFQVDFDQASGTGTSWGVGLRRSRNNNTGIGASTRKPQYFTDDGESLASSIFFDYVVMAVQNAPASDRYLRVYQCCIKEGVTYEDAMSRNAPVSMREIEYWGGHNPKFAAPYNMSTNFANASYTHVEFEMLGDELILNIGTSAATTALVHPVTLTGSGKINVFKPIALTTELLYPQLWIQKKDKKLTVSNYSGKTGYTFGDPNRDWWARMEKQGLTNRFCKEVDTRYWADLTNAPMFAYKRPTGGGYAETDKPPVLILTEDPVNYVNTVNANCELLLGFDSQSVVDDATYAKPTYTFVSNTAPDVTSRGSAFIRLNNFTQQSFNAGKGALSKILYHIPRFDNSGNATGSDLFFEPTEKTYVALNNPNDLHINSFDVDIVTEEETFASDLVGKTIVVFHVRQQK
jgi:hypothetical protein